MRPPWASVVKTDLVRLEILEACEVYGMVPGPMAQRLLDEPTAIRFEVSAIMGRIARLEAASVAAHALLPDPKPMERREAWEAARP